MRFMKNSEFIFVIGEKSAKPTGSSSLLCLQPTN